MTRPTKTQVGHELGRLASRRRRLAIAAVTVVALVGGTAAYASAGPGGHDQGAAKLAEKAARKAEATAQLHPAPKHPDAPPEPNPPVVGPRAPEGISRDSGPFSAVEFSIQDMWRGQVGRDWYEVYAGDDREPSGLDETRRGALRIFSYPLDGRPTKDLGVFLAPGSRALRIRSVDARRIATLSSASGRVLHFDIAHLRFLQ